MVIQVCKDVRITYSDGMNYCIERRTVITNTSVAKNKGKERWLNVGYFGCLDTAIKSLMTRHIGLIIDSRTGNPSKKLYLKLNQAYEAIMEAREAALAAIGQHGKEEEDQGEGAA